MSITDKPKQAESTSVDELLTRCQQWETDAVTRTDLQDKLDLELGGVPDVQKALLNDLSVELNETPKKRGIASHQIVEQADSKINAQEQLGLFTTLPCQPSDEYPTLLGRLPIFLPVHRSKQKKHLDKDNAYAFETPFGSGRRFGANLSIKDEDILYALLRLRRKKIRGLPSKLPIHENDIYGRDEDGFVTVFATYCTIADIHHELGIGNSGGNYEETLDSIKRLNSCTIELELRKHDKYLGNIKKGTSIDLLKVVWNILDEYQTVYVQFNPVVVRWIENDFTYVNWETRRQLKGDVEKAMHRFLSTQPKYYERKVSEIAATIGLLLPSNKIRSTLEAAIKNLVKIGFIQEYEISGTGRRTPFVLKTWR